MGSKMNQKRTKPAAVIIGDIHFTPATLDLATASFLHAKDKAKSLGVPLILNGDTLDSKAIMRGECVNRLLELVKSYSSIVVNIGNHDLLNEKGSEHVLNFLKDHCTVVDEPYELYADSERSKGMYIIPYQNSAEKLVKILDSTPKESMLILHQGVQTAYMGHYTQDRTSLSKDTFADFRVISSHYHRKQDIKCGCPRQGGVGLFSYIGNPYTLNFGEAQDGDKGFAVIYDDGSLEHVPTNLRKHVVLDCFPKEFNTSDLYWIKIKGPKSELAKIKKTGSYKLDLIPTDSIETNRTEGMTDSELLDSLINNLGETDDQKKYLKDLWREIL